MKLLIPSLKVMLSLLLFMRGDKMAIQFKGDTMEDIMITIPRERYEELVKSESKLSALFHAGVDNWDGYDDAMETLEAD